MTNQSKNYQQPSRKARCIFCDVMLTKSPNGKDRPSDRAKEHVLKKSFIKALDHDETKVHNSYRTGQKLIGKRSVPALNYLAGEVCRGCNGGWIDKLDISVANIVLAAANSTAPIISFTDDEAFALSRWILKVACVTESTDTKNRRHIPVHVRRSLRNEDYLPPHFISFYTKISAPERDIAPVILDFWPSYGPRSLAFTAGNQFKRLKFGVRYNQVIFGCAYVDEPQIEFEGVTGFHNKIYASSDTSMRLTKNQDLIDLITLPHPHLDNTILNKCILSIAAYNPKNLNILVAYWVQ